ncbi:MFS transporter [Actinomadura graeca]|uniref:MFS transporter n=1 Tax=Actinomadura graeca TaxID=2750812 RepID=A0ABX8QV08_9ACTN|nr:MFS transporter [Actinomadura graeca]QXJ22473.1 MFS transporter [Actinomadura graeca]
MLTLLRERAFRRLWLSYSASAAATGMMPTALTLAVLDASAGLSALGLVLGARTLGFVIGSLPGGVIADRYPRAAVLTVSSAVRGGATAVVGLWADLPLLAVCAAICCAGAGEGTFRSAYQALVAELVDEDRLHQANAATTLSLRIWLVGGPTAAVALYTQFGRGASLTIAAALWLGSALLTVTVPAGRPSPPPAGARANALAEFREGLAEARRHRWFLAGITALVFWLALGEAAKYVMLPVVSQQRFGSNALIGAALGAYSCGAIAGALLMSRWRPRRVGVPAMVMLGCYGLVPLSLAHASHSWTIIAACALGGVGIEVFNIPWFTAIQREVPAGLQARISSLDFLVSYGMSPVGFAVIPVAVGALGATAVLDAAGLLVIGSALAALLVPGTTRFSDPRAGEVGTPEPQAGKAGAGSG